MAKTDALTVRKTPRQTRSAATVDAILEAAARILETGGLAEYSTNAVARRAGVSVGSLYQYFPNKDAITRELTFRRTADLVADIDAAFSDASKACALSQVIDIAVRHQQHRPRLSRILDAEESRLPPDPALRELAAGVLAHLQRGLHANGYEGDTMEASLDIMAIIRGMVDAANARGEGDPVRLSSRVRRAVFGYLERGA